MCTTSLTTYFDLIHFTVSLMLSSGVIFTRCAIRLKPSTRPAPVSAEHGWMNQSRSLQLFLRLNCSVISVTVAAPTISCLLARTTTGSLLRWSLFKVCSSTLLDSFRPLISEESTTNTIPSCVLEKIPPVRSHLSLPSNIPHSQGDFVPVLLRFDHFYIESNCRNRVKVLIVLQFVKKCWFSSSVKPQEEDTGFRFVSGSGMAHCPCQM